MTSEEKTNHPEFDEQSNGGSLADYMSDTGSWHSSSHDTSPTAPPLAQKENKAVTWSKGLVVLVLCIATTACASTTFKYTKRQEELDFQTRFNDFANQIIAVYQINARNIIDAYETLSLSMTAEALGEGSEWPFVTIPKYAAQASKAMNMTGAINIFISPLVTEEKRSAWEQYAIDNQGWIQESYNYLGLNETPPDITPFIYGDRFAKEPGPLNSTKESFSHYAPLWQTSNLPSTRVMFDVFRYTHLPWVYKRMVASNKPVLSEVYNLNNTNGTWPRSFMNVPIYADVIEGAEIVGILVSILPWHNYFDNLIPEGIDGFHLVIRNECKRDFTYQINGPVVDFLGVGDFHEVEYDQYEVTTDFTTFTDVKECLNTLHIYPSQEFREEYVTNKPIIYMGATVFIFLLTALVFIIYDCLVERRQDKVLTTATRSNAIVSSLFPTSVQERLMDDAANARKKGQPKNFKLMDNRMPFSVKHNRDVSLDSIREEESMKEKVVSSCKPIADLFPNATVLFADIVGFTAWSSVREPDQVFILLEGIYNSFDKLARRRKVFKVETIGDCYVAATGLPERNKDHAILMARFARSCLSKMNQVVRSLEVTLGPDTAELGMRIGLHSGPVTAGVLRGEKSRFQLFGDTVNTAARMESTGVKNKIHLSKDTADLITAASCKDIWVKPRDTFVDVKGKGQMQTYWLVYTSGATASTVSTATGFLSTYNFGNSVLNNVQEDDDINIKVTAATLKLEQIQKLERLIDWNVDVLQGLLKRCIAMRGTNGKLRMNKKVKPPMMIETSDMTVLDEVREIITLPSKPSEYSQDPESIILDPVVVHQLRQYVSAIAAMYNNNPFHCFDHASHVTKSVTKLLARIVTSDTYEYGDLRYNKKAKESTLHRFTYGITSDPLTHFAVVFSALIHDAEHPGVPNSQLVKEKSENAILYKNKSVAEQNSVDKAWNLLMKPDYSDLRACIYTTQSELDRFRQLVVNAVMATDIVDKELGALRRKRWERAFDSISESVSKNKSSTSKEDMNRKATIVIEHLIQASDVAHTMQHWHVYLKWNERLFHECYRAYNKNRAEKNPVDYWYEAELGFFDHYIIPLAKKLQECGVFGVASDEYLNYAKANRQEWELKGKSLVMDYVSSFESGRHLLSMDSNELDIYGGDEMKTQTA